MKTVTDRLAILLPELTKELREQFNIRKFYVGGGFLRDTYLGTEPKDIDVFVHYKYFTKTQPYITNPKDYPNVDIIGVIKDMLSVQGYDVDIIQLGSEIDNTHEGVYGRFDIGLSQIICDQDGHIKTSPTFDSDVENKTITAMRRNSTGSLRLMKRLERYKEKYPDYTVLDPLNLTHD